MYFVYHLILLLLLDLSSGPKICQSNSDCNNNPDIRPRQCTPGFKNMTTDCECLKAMYCRDQPKESQGYKDCPLWCNPKKVEGCSHWGEDCNVCIQRRGINPCIIKNKSQDIRGTCQKTGKCDYPNNSK